MTPTSLFLLLFNRTILISLLTGFSKRYVATCLLEQLFTEYVEVLNREKFSKFPDFHFRAQTLLADIEIRALKFSPTISLNIISDSADNRLLELAETCEADYLVTGNTNDFTMPEHKGTKIVSPKEFFELLSK